MKLYIPLNHIFPEAWKRTISNKVLWVFGALAISLGASFSSMRSLPQDFISDGPNNMGDIAPESFAFIALAVMGMLFVGIVFFILVTLFTSSLANGVAKVDANEPVGLRLAFTAQGFWRIIGLEILLALSMGAMLFAWLFHMVLLAGTLIGILLVPFVFIGGIMGMGAVVFAMASFQFFAIFEIVVAGKKIGPAIHSAWATTKTHVADSVVVGGVLSILNGVVMGVYVVFATVVGLAGGLIVFGTTSSDTNWFAPAFIGFVIVYIGVIGLLGLLIRAILTTFNYHVFIQAWKRLTQLG